MVRSGRNHKCNIHVQKMYNFGGLGGLLGGWEGDVRRTRSAESRSGH